MSRVLLVLVVIGASTASAQPDAEHVLTEVDNVYATGVATATMDFSQTITDGTDTTTFIGRMWVQGTDKLRWEYEELHDGKARVTKIFIKDGVKLTVIDKAALTVTQVARCASLAPEAMAFMSGDLASSFTPAVVGRSKGKLDLQLTPKAGSGRYSTLVLTVDATIYVVERAVAIDPAGNANGFAFSDVRWLLDPLPPSTFTVNLGAMKKRGFMVVKPASGCSQGAATTAVGAGAASGMGTQTPTE